MSFHDESAADLPESVMDYEKIWETVGAGFDRSILCDNPRAHEGINHATLDTISVSNGTRT